MFVSSSENLSIFLLKYNSLCIFLKHLTNSLRPCLWRKALFAFPEWTYGHSVVIALYHAFITPKDAWESRELISVFYYFPSFVLFFQNNFSVCVCLFCLSSIQRKLLLPSSHNCHQPLCL